METYKDNGGRKAIYLKIAGAFLFLLSLTLPISSCSHYADRQGKITVPSGENKPLSETDHRVTTYHYVLKDFHAARAGEWLFLGGFVWPSLMLIVLNRMRSSRILIALRAAELLLLAWSQYAILAFLILSDPEAGAYAAEAGLIVYGIGALWLDASAIRTWMKRRTQ